MCLRRAFFLWRLCFVCCLYISTQEVANPNPQTVTYSWISLSSSNNPSVSCTDVVRKHHWNSTSSWCIMYSIICGLEFSRMDSVLKYCRVISSTIAKNVYVVSFTCHSPPYQWCSPKTVSSSSTASSPTKLMIHCIISSLSGIVEISNLV